MTHNAPSPTDSRLDAADRWAGQEAWCVLHTAFDQGSHFLHTWAAWRADPQRPRMLHYVALTPHVPDAPHPLDGGGWSPLSAEPVARELVLALQAQCCGLLPGQHRLVFENGQVLLTLCIGPTQAVLREQQFEADGVVLAPSAAEPDPWDDWAVKALVRCCRRGTRLALWQSQPSVQHSLRQCGFVLQDAAGDPGQPQYGVFDPRWELKTTREPWRRARAAPQSCAVIGAGLAGASVAASLARRGWQVQVLDQADRPAAGASGLPVGLAAPHVSVDDCVLSRLSRSGVRLSLQQARQLLIAGQDWAPSGVHEYLFDDHAPQPQSPRWHPHAAWIKPGALVRTWLAQPGIQFQGGVQVHTLQRSAAGWTLLDPAGHAITTVARVVLANATGALPLLQRMQASQPDLPLGLHQLPAVYGVRGLVSWAAHDAPETRPFPPGPVNGSGSLIPHVPFDGGACWFVGASYQPLGPPEWPDDKNHGANVLRLEKLQPTLFEALTPVLEAGALQAWKGVRCVTADRLPMVGSLQDLDQSLWMCAGMGSRGLSHAPLCAELLAAQWAGEPLPIEASLAQALHARRHRLEAKAQPV